MCMCVYVCTGAPRVRTYPLNLEGIWTEEMHPNWNSEYTTNINLEMNYWAVEVVNLGMCVCVCVCVCCVCVCVCVCCVCVCVSTLVYSFFAYVTHTHTHTHITHTQVSAQNL